MSSPRFGEQVEDDPSLCYRHPDRQSWVLCQRCGRTICAECQILAPVGVQCPECVRESGGAPWKPQGAPRKTSARTSQRTAQRASFGRTRSALGGLLSTLMKPGGDTPSLSWFFAGGYCFFWILGLITANAPFRLLAAAPGAESWQIWRYFTSAAVTPASLNLVSILTIVLHLFFWLLFAPMAERHFGRQRFLVIFFTATAVGSAGMVALAGGAGFGIASGLFGLFGAYAVVMWSDPRVRRQIIVMAAFNLVLNLALGGGSIPLILGAFLGGGGASYLLLFYAKGKRANTPYLIILGGVFVAILLAIVSSSGGLF